MLRGTYGRGRGIPGRVVSPAPMDRRLRNKNIADALILAALAVLFWLITIVKLSGNVA